MIPFYELSTKEQKAVLSIVDEYKRAIAKHPNWPDNPIEQAAIVCEESGELIRAALQRKYEGGNDNELQKEAIQTGAMAMRFIVNINP